MLYTYALNQCLESMPKTYAENIHVYDGHSDANTLMTWSVSAHTRLLAVLYTMMTCMMGAAILTP